MKTTTLLRLHEKIGEFDFRVKNGIYRIFQFFKIVPIFYGRNPERISDYNFIYKVKGEVRCLISPNEALTIIMCTRKTQKLGGSIAEVGVYNGGSAKLISRSKGDRSLFLFDTFTGLPSVGNIDTENFYLGEFQSDRKRVEKYLHNYKNIFIYPGIFPDSSKPINNRRYPDGKKTEEEYQENWLQ